MRIQHRADWYSGIENQTKKTKVYGEQFLIHLRFLIPKRNTIIPQLFPLLPL